MLTIKQALMDARSSIDVVDARILLAHTLAVRKTYLATHPEQCLSLQQQQRYRSLLNRRAQGEPVAFILGRREFYGMDFTVTPDVLIPRPDTELLVELALERIPVDQTCDILELGIGSGAIAIAVARHRPLATITALDISTAALGVARENAVRLLGMEAAARLNFICSDWYAGLDRKRYDLILSNPPYIAEDDHHLSEGDLRFEPIGALASGKNGLDALRIIAAGAPDRLNAGGWLLCEHGFDQEAATHEIFAAAGFQDIACHKDLAGIGRTTLGRLNA